MNKSAKTTSPLLLLSPLFFLLLVAGNCRDTSGDGSNGGPALRDGGRGAKGEKGQGASANGVIGGCLGKEVAAWRRKGGGGEFG